MNEATLGYKFGVKLACAYHGIDPGALMTKAAKVYTCLESPVMQHAFAKIASTIMHNAGPEFAAEEALFNAIANRHTPLTSFVKKAFLYPVLDTLANAAATCSMEKSAGVFNDIISGVGSVLNGSQEALYKLALIGALGGAGIGALGWNLSRHMREEDADTAAKIEQAKHYRQIARDLQKRLNAEASGSADHAKLRRLIEAEDEGDVVL